MSEPYDTVFSLPSLDDGPDTEIGVLLMGLGPERLLAGLGVATGDPAADPATVTLVVDQLRHGMRPGESFDAAVAAGARRWRSAHAALVATETLPAVPTAALRRLWESCGRALAAGAELAPRLRTAGDAERVYLTTCLSRSAEITKIVEEHVVLPELPS